MQNESSVSNKLSNKDLGELAIILNVLPSESAIHDLERLDGFFTALLCCPNAILPSKFMQVIFGNEKDDEVPFDDIEQYERFFGLLMVFGIT